MTSLLANCLSSSNDLHGFSFRNLEEANESNLSASKRGKGRKGKLKGSAYTGNPLSPKMTGSGKRGKLKLCTNTFSYF